MALSIYQTWWQVIRRVGGLEITPEKLKYLHYVIRRVGGLETCHNLLRKIPVVIRRVGGLETLKDEYQPA